jgi:hypothetical protein
MLLDEQLSNNTIFLSLSNWPYGPFNALFLVLSEMSSKEAYLEAKNSNLFCAAMDKGLGWMGR